MPVFVDNAVKEKVEMPLRVGRGGSADVAIL